MALVNGELVSPVNGVIEGTHSLLPGDSILADATDSGTENQPTVIEGYEGPDSIGTSGNYMTLNGDGGTDTLSSQGNNNTLVGGSDDDFLLTLPPALNTIMEGGPGADQLLGFGENDTASYANASGGVTVDLSVGMASDDGDGGSDLLIGIENVTGSTFADSLTGDSGSNVLEGGGGDDTLAGGGGSDTFNYSFTLEQTPGQANTLTFTDWLSAKYGKDFGDQLPDFDGGHDRHHHHHGEHHRNDDHGKHHHGKHHHDHGKHEHDHHYSHHHNHGGCDDHQPPQWGLSQEFFAKNYGQWLKEVVVADLVAQGLVQDTNGNGKTDIDLNLKDPHGTPQIEGLSDDVLSAIFGDRDDVTLRHHHHGHEAWYSNSYTSSSGAGETTVASSDGDDTILDFSGSEDDVLQFNFTAAADWADNVDDPLGYLQSLFTVTADEVNNSTTIAAGDFSVTLADQLFGETNGVNDVFDHIDIYVNDTLIG